MVILGSAFTLLSVLQCGPEPGSKQKTHMLDGLAGARPGEGRLSQLPWASYSPRRSPQSMQSFRQTADLAREALAARRTSETLRNDAIVALVAGNTKLGIAELAEATQQSPEDASLWSDLAAAHLQRNAALSDPYELVLALAAADRAVRIDPSLLPARFNRALAYEGLSLRRAAAADWQMLEDREHDPGWRGEISDHVMTLHRPLPRVDWQASLAAVEEAVHRGDAGKVRSIVSDSPQRFREYVEEQLLPTWGRQDGAAEKSLAVARALGQALAATHKDRMTADTVNQIARLQAVDPEGSRQLARALQAYGEGVSLMQQEAFSLALPHFHTARKALSRLRSPFAGWATFQTGYCQIRTFDMANARTLLEELTQTPWVAQYKALHGRTLWMLALIEAVEGNLTASLTDLEIALRNFQALGEKDNVAWLRAFVAVDFDYLGKRNEAWRQLYPVLQELESLDKPQAQMAVWHAAASLAHEQGELGVAQAFVDELLRSTKATGQSSAIVEALRWRAVILAKLGRKADAAGDLREAWAYQQRVSDPRSRRSLEGDLRLAEGELAVGVSPEQAIAALDPAIEIFRSLSYHYQLGHAFYLRALAEDKLGRFDDEERDLAAAIAELERQREKVTAPEERVSYLDRRRELLDSMISFQLYRRRRPAAALRFSENAKARVLWDWILTQPGSGGLRKDLDRSRLSPADSGTLARDLPEGTAVIEYAVLPRSTIIWLLRRDTEPKVVTVEVGAERLGGLVQTLQRAVMNGRSAVLEMTSEKLRDILLKPFERNLSPGERLVFIPDGPLHGLPFALLRDRQTGRYLIQDHVCSVAPSIRVFKASRHRDKFLARRITPRALVIADPDFDRTLYSSLPRLTAVETEASITQIFPDSQVLRDRNATRRAFLSSAGGFEIVHFGGHSVVNTEFPLLSQMVLAGDPEDPNRGVLYSGDLLHLHFARTRLVVLASCATAVGRISRTEGVENLARPFLAAGVPAVVASLWSVDDDPTSHFFSRFYRHFHSSVDAAAALRATQVEAIEHGEKGSENPRTWAAFEVIGGSALAE